MIVFFVLLLLNVAVIRGDEECLHRDYGYNGTVCVCNSQHCDTIGPIQKLFPGEYVIYTSNQQGLRFKKTTGNFLSNSVHTNRVEINHLIKYQTIIGWGGCFTDATGINFNALTGKAREHIMRSYFSEDGIGYNLGRVPIGSTDFGTRGYTYLDTEEPDWELANFELQPEDHQYKIPVIKEAMEMTNNEMLLLASAWTAPKWMKTNGEYAGLGFLIREFYQLWVDYMVKFLDVYKSYGLEFWGITTGNEPSLGLPGMDINSVGWEPWNMRWWIKTNLGPTLRNSQYSDIKIMGHDDQRLFLPFLFITFDDEETTKYVDGIAVHYYWDRWLPSSWLTNIHNKYPEKFILGTEASAGNFPWDQAIELGNWDRGELYAEDIIEDLQNWVAGWMDWCMALDLEGGPSYINNFVDSPIIVNATANEFYKNPMFYALGHFSKFLPRGSVRIDAPKIVDDLLVVAFYRPDGGTFVGLINREWRDIKVAIYDPNFGYIDLEVSAKSFNSIVYW